MCNGYYNIYYSIPNYFIYSSKGHRIEKGEDL